MPTLAVFIGVMGGLSAFGFIGLFLGPIVLGLVVALFRFATEEVASAQTRRLNGAARHEEPCLTNSTITDRDPPQQAGAVAGRARRGTAAQRASGIAGRAGADDHAGRSRAGSRAGRSGRQGSLRQGARGGDAGTARRDRRAFDEGRAERTAARVLHRGGAAARESARCLHFPALREACRPAAGRARRHFQPATPGAVAPRPAGPAARAAARQRRYTPAPARRGRARCDPARVRGAGATRPRRARHRATRSRAVVAGRRPGRDWYRVPYRRCAQPRSAAGHCIMPILIPDCWPSARSPPRWVAVVIRRSPHTPRSTATRSCCAASSVRPTAARRFAIE